MQRDTGEIEEALGKHIDELVSEYGVKLVYVFGSYAKNKNRQDSDLDIAMYFGRKEDGFLKLAVLDDLVGIFRREDIDLVILDDADEVLKFQVIKYGQVVYMQDLITKVMFEARVLSEYMDMEYFRRVRNEYGHRRFVESMKSDL